MSSVIREVEVSGSIIEDIVYEKLVPALNEVDAKQAVLAMLTFCTILMKPSVTVEELQQAVMSSSEALVTALVPAEGNHAN